MTYPWWDRWGSLGHRRFSLPAFKVAAAVEVSAWFIEHHGDDAEDAGFRPVHLMRPTSGLAWRWWNVPEPVLTFGAGQMSAQIGRFTFTYAPRPDGSVAITGVS